MNKIILIDSTNENNDIIFSKKNDIIYWNRSRTYNHRSILTFIEKNDKYYKQKYLKFISSIKESHFLKKSLKNNYIICDNFSLWEMSLFEEKSIYKTPEINELIKILALKDIIKKKRIKKINLYSDNKELKHNILSLIKGIKIEANSLNTHLYKKIVFLRNNFFYFIYFLINFFLKRFTFKNYTKKLKKNSILIFDYFAYFDETKVLKGKFDSSYWRNFVPILKNKNINLNFLHITLDEKNYSFYKKINIIKKLNNSESISHNILDTQIDFLIFLKVLIVFLRNYTKYNFLKIRYKNNYIFQNHILHKMFKDSFAGVWSIKNLYFFFMFEKFIKNYCKDNKISIYINEFQGWEKSMIFNLRKFSNADIYGLQFNPVRNWDLRYISNISKDNRNLFPDKIIGFYKSNKDQLKKISLLHKKIKIIITNNLRPFSFKFKNFKKSKILLIGDHDDKSTINLLSIANNFSKNSNKNIFEYKPHPISKVKVSNFGNLKNIKVYKGDDCFKTKYSAYIVSNKTSLGLELLTKNFKTAIILDKESLNLSPVSEKYKFFISNETELKNFIKFKNHYNSKKQKLKIIPWIKLLNLWKRKI